MLENNQYQTNSIDQANMSCETNTAASCADMSGAAITDADNAPQSSARYDRTNDQMFKSYKQYKKKQPEPDFSAVIDPHNADKFSDQLRCIDPVSDLQPAGAVGDSDLCRVGLRPLRTWKVFELKACPGFLFVCDPFVNAAAHSHWVKQSLTEYTRNSYPNNLDALMELDKSTSVWDISASKSEDNSFIKQLRWSHLGYHFDYNTVDYKAKKYYGFPTDLAALTETIAHVFGYPQYYPETGIINYYPTGASMGGHTDHYEEILAQPLISFSFGQAAVFLIGGTSRDVVPAAVWLRSGDVVLMTGESRTCFHAVPCIVNKPTRSGPADIPYCALVSEQTRQSIASGTRNKKPDKATKGRTETTNRNITNTTSEHESRGATPNKLSNLGEQYNPKEATIQTQTTLLSDTTEESVDPSRVMTSSAGQQSSSQQCFNEAAVDDHLAARSFCSCGHASTSLDQVATGDDSRAVGGDTAGATAAGTTACQQQHVWRDELADRAAWEPFSKYIANTRININIRQVHKYQPAE